MQGLEQGLFVVQNCVVSSTCNILDSIKVVNKPILLVEKSLFHLVLEDFHISRYKLNWWANGNYDFLLGFSGLCNVFPVNKLGLHSLKKQCHVVTYSFYLYSLWNSFRLIIIVFISTKSKVNKHLCMLFWRIAFYSTDHVFILRLSCVRAFLSYSLQTILLCAYYVFAITSEMNLFAYLRKLRKRVYR